MLFSIIVAGGIGTRMGGEIPKQFMLLGNKPILMHTLQKFYTFDAKMPIILVLHKDWWDYWENLKSTHIFEVPHILVEGGNTRIQSVKNAIDFISKHISQKKGLENGVFVSIHDAVRPFVGVDILQKNFELAFKNKSAVTVISLKDSLRYVEGDNTQALDRSLYRLVQTPQTFDFLMLKNAYNQPNIEGLTDDASVWEKAGHKVYVCEGDYKNIKITTPEDMQIAESFL